MARQVSNTTSRLNANLSPEEKALLVQEASKHGFQTVAEFLQAIANRKLVYIDADAALLLDHIRASAQK